MTKIRLSDFIADRLIHHGIKDVFMVSGGGAMHLNDALGNHPGISYYCNHHEQACAIAAEGYYRSTGNMPVVNITTGPGGTNAITGVLGQWLDSIPALYISGQVKWETTIYSCPEIKNLRQLGDQEGDIINIVKPITKYSVLLQDPLQVKKILDKAIYLATHGRPGPVWIDIPLDVQAALIDPTCLDEYDSDEDCIVFDEDLLNSQAEILVNRILSAKSPLLYVGNGIRLSDSLQFYEKILDLLGIPVLTSISGHDLISSDSKLFMGRPGVFGDRLGNIMIQNCDLLVVIGTRMGIRQTTYNFEDFGRNAFKVMIDIDDSELHKPIFKVDLKINSDIKIFLKILLGKLDRIRKPDFTSWINWGNNLKEKLPTMIEDNPSNPGYVNSYLFADRLFRLLPDDSLVVTGNGTAFTCTLQIMKIKPGMRVFANQGCASMGYDLPAAIGASIARKEEVVLITGDGSLMMNLQELQTIVNYKLPIKIFVLENDGYLAIRITQTNFFNKRFVGESPKSGVKLPDLQKIAYAFGIKYYKISDEENLDDQISEVIKQSGPVFCEIKMDPNQTLYPKVVSVKTPEGRMISKPLELMFPFLPSDIDITYK